MFSISTWSNFGKDKMNYIIIIRTSSDLHSTINLDKIHLGVLYMNMYLDVCMQNIKMLCKINNI